MVPLMLMLEDPMGFDGVPQQGGAGTKGPGKGPSSQL